MKKNVIFLHAFPLNWKMWTYQLDLNKYYDIYALDYQNLGKENLKDYAEFVYEFCKEKGIKKAFFVGLSMGGYIIFEILKNYRNLVEGIVLANTKASSDSEEIRKKRYELIERIKKEGKEFLIKQYVPKFLKIITKEKEDFLVQMIIDAKEDKIINTLKALANREDNTNLLKSIEIPTLIIAGKDDEISTIEDAKNMHKSIKNSKLIIFENCKHLSNIEHPEEFNKTLRDFIK